MHWPITVASFRTWRGSRDYIARDPASDNFDINIRVSSTLAYAQVNAAARWRLPQHRLGSGSTTFTLQMEASQFQPRGYEQGAMAGVRQNALTNPLQSLH